MVRLSDYYTEMTHECCVDLWVSEDSPKRQLTFHSTPSEEDTAYAINNAIEMVTNPPQSSHIVIPEEV